MKKLIPIIILLSLIFGKYVLADTLNSCQATVKKTLMHPINKQPSSKNYVKLFSDVMYADKNANLTYLKKLYLLTQSMLESATGTHLLSYFNNPFNFSASCNESLSRLPFMYQGGDPLKCYRNFKSFEDLLNTYVKNSKYSSAFEEEDTSQFIISICKSGYAQACRYTSTCTSNAVPDKCGCMLDENGKKKLVDTTLWKKNTTIEDQLQCYQESGYYINMQGHFERVKKILNDCDEVSKNDFDKIVEGWDEGKISNAPTKVIIDGSIYISTPEWYKYYIKNSEKINLKNKHIVEKTFFDSKNIFKGRYIHIEGEELNDVIDPEKFSDKPKYIKDLCAEFNFSKITLEKFKTEGCSYQHKEGIPNLVHELNLKAIFNSSKNCKGVNSVNFPWLPKLLTCVAKVETKGHPYLISHSGNDCGGKDGDIAYGLFQIQKNNLNKDDAHFIGKNLSTFSSWNENQWVLNYSFDESMLIKHTICDNNGQKSTCLGLYTVSSKLDDFIKRISSIQSTAGLPKDFVTVGKAKFDLKKFSKCKDVLLESKSDFKLRNACLGIAMGLMYNSSSSEYSQYAEKISFCMNNEETFYDFQDLKNLISGSFQKLDT